MKISHPLARLTELVAYACTAAGLALAPAALCGQSPTVTAATAQETDRPVQIDEATMLAHAITKAAPIYPVAAKEQHLSGSVVIYGVINENGTIKSLSVVSGPNVFRIAALNALNQWTFQPYQLNGKPAKVGTLFTVNFTPPAN